MQPSGFLLIDKPTGWTSHDVVAKLRRITGIKKIGHGGTLDPLATGLLVVGIGAATKQLEQFVQGDKTYLATVRLGASSDTDDAEGVLRPHPGAAEPPRHAVEQTLGSFMGEQQQLPPVYSALKTAGKKHYQLARAGKAVVRTPRTITIHRIGLISYTWPDIEFRCSVSKGTYIRSIARDLGDKLGTGGYLTELRRVSVGPCAVDDAAPMDEVAKNWRERLIALAN